MVLHSSVGTATAAHYRRPSFITFRSTPRESQARRIVYASPDLLMPHARPGGRWKDYMNEVSRPVQCLHAYIDHRGIAFLVGAHESIAARHFGRGSEVFVPGHLRQCGARHATIPVHPHVQRDETLVLSFLEGLRVAEFGPKFRQADRYARVSIDDQTSPLRSTRPGCGAAGIRRR